MMLVTAKSEKGYTKQAHQQISHDEKFQRPPGMKSVARVNESHSDLCQPREYLDERESAKRWNIRRNSRRAESTKDRKDD